jgi:hypothetical protein
MKVGNYLLLTNLKDKYRQTPWHFDKKELGRFVQPAENDFC